MTHTAAERSRARDMARTPALFVLLLAGALVTYKAAGSVRVIDQVRAGSGFPASSAPAGLDLLSRSIDYLAVVWPALVFGILISAAVRAFVSAEWLTQVFSRNRYRAQLAGGLAGSPLMLCSCCVAPIFSTVYRRSSSLAPSLALMLAAPALNPAALVLTFMLFTGAVAWARLSMAVAAVFLGTALIAMVVPGRRGGPVRAGVALGAGRVPTSSPPVGTFIQSCVHVLVRTVPPLALGIAGGLVIAEYFPITYFDTWNARLLAIAVTAAVVIPIPLPTFFEIPLAVALLAAGAPAGAATVVLFAGPAVNLPSLLTVAHEAGWHAGVLSALMVWLVAVTGGMIVG